MKPIPAHHAFSLIEIIVVLMIIAIASALAVPMFSKGSSAKLVEAAQILAADLGHAQVESISHGDDTRVVVFDTATASYHLAASSDPTTPLNHPIGNKPYVVTFGKGMAAPLTRVTLQSVSLDGDDTLGFGIYGQLDQTTDATITLECDLATLTLTLDPITGEVTIGSLN